MFAEIFAKSELEPSSRGKRSYVTTSAELKLAVIKRKSTPVAEATKALRITANGFRFPSNSAYEIRLELSSAEVATLVNFMFEQGLVQVSPVDSKTTRARVKAPVTYDV